MLVSGCKWYRGAVSTQHWAIAKTEIYKMYEENKKQDCNWCVLLTGQIKYSFHIVQQIQEYFATKRVNQSGQYYNCNFDMSICCRDMIVGNVGITFFEKCSNTKGA